MNDHNLIRRGDVLAIVKPDGARDCDCTRCICGDEIEVSLWDQSKRHSDAIAALPAADVKALVEALEWQASQPEAHPFMAERARAAIAAFKGDEA